MSAFGIGGVLFGGIIVGHFVDQAGVTLSGDMLHFIEGIRPDRFLFIPSAYRWGRGFRLAARFRAASQSVCCFDCDYGRVAVTAILHKIFAIPLPVVLGIFSRRSHQYACVRGGSANPARSGTPVDLVDQMGMSYAMAYPFGICGIFASPCG